MRSPRSARETWRASSSRRAPPAPMRRRNVPTASPLFQVTTPRPRRIRHDAGRSISARRAARIGASAGSTTNSRCVRPPARLSEPRDRNRPRSQAVRQWSAACDQSKRLERVIVELVAEPHGKPGDRALAGGPLGAARPSPTASATRSHGRDGSMAASSARSASTRSRSERVIGRVTASGRGGRRAHAVRPTAWRATTGGRSRTPMMASASRSGSWWWALSGSTTSRSTSSGTGSPRAASAAGRSPRSTPPGDRASRRVVGQDDVDEARRRVRDEGLEVRRPGEARGLARLGGDVADEDRRRRRVRIASRMPGTSRLGSRLVYRLRAEDDEVRLADGLHRVARTAEHRPG